MYIHAYIYVYIYIYIYIIYTQMCINVCTYISCMYSEFTIKLSRAEANGSCAEMNSSNLLCNFSTELIIGMYIHIYVCVRVYVCVGVCVCVYGYVCVCVCLCVCVLFLGFTL